MEPNNEELSAKGYDEPNDDIDEKGFELEKKLSLFKGTELRELDVEDWNNDRGTLSILLPALPRIPPCNELRPPSWDPLEGGKILFSPIFSPSPFIEFIESSFNIEEDNFDVLETPKSLTESNNDDDRLDEYKGKSDLELVGSSLRGFKPSLLIFEKNLDSHLDEVGMIPLPEKDWLISELPDKSEWLSNNDDDPKADDPDNAEEPRVAPSVDEPKPDDPSPKEEKLEVRDWSGKSLDTSGEKSVACSIGSDDDPNNDEPNDENVEDKSNSGNFCSTIVDSGRLDTEGEMELLACVSCSDLCCVWKSVLNKGYTTVLK